MQLRKNDLRFETVDGQRVPFLRISPDAGSVKSGNYRMVPLHPQLQEMGLVDLIQGLPEGPVFYSMERKRKEADALERARNPEAAALGHSEDCAPVRPLVLPGVCLSNRVPGQARLRRLGLHDRRDGRRHH